MAFCALASSAALADTTVTIGHAGPLTGPIAHIGKDGEDGARLAIEDANAEHLTIGGDKVRFVLKSEDDQGDPRQATTVAQRLADAEVNGVVGHVTSGASIPASRIYERAGIPVITPSSTSPKLTHQGYEVTFRVIANDLQQGAAMARYATGPLKLKTVAVVDDRTAYGQGLADAFADAFRGRGGKVVRREFTNDKATDFTAILTNIKASRPDAIFYGGMDAQAAPMLRQIRQLGIKAAFLGGDGVCTSEMVKLGGPAMDASTYCTQAGIPPSRMPGGEQFMKRFHARFHTDVQLYAPYSYDATMALIQAMRNAGSAQPAKYLPYLRKLDMKGITGTIAFDERGDIKDGGVTLFRFAKDAWQPVD